MSVKFWLSLMVIGIGLNLALGVTLPMALTIAFAMSSGWFCRGYFDREDMKPPTYTVRTTYDSVDARRHW